MTSQDAYLQTRLQFHKGRKEVWRAICQHLQPEIHRDSVILELGPGYCDFINQIVARKKIAVDVRPEIRNFCNSDVQFVPSDITQLNFEKSSVDVIFASNLLEHLHDEQLELLFSQIDKILKEEGKLILIQPNYYYCYREYWDDFTHVKAFSHLSLCDFLRSKNYSIDKVVKRFLPFSFHSRFPTSYFFTRAYLSLPYHPWAKQMLIIARKVSI